MKFGVCIPHYGIPLEVDNLTKMAVNAEEMGFDSVWVTDHIIVPHEVPDRPDIVYRHDMLEPVSLLTHLGAVTKRVNIGTSVIILPYRNPIILAKAIATADVLSKGRVIFGAVRMRALAGSLRSCAVIMESPAGNSKASTRAAAPPPASAPRLRSQNASRLSAITRLKLR